MTLLCTPLNATGDPSPPVGPALHPAYVLQRLARSTSVHSIETAIDCASPHKDSSAVTASSTIRCRDPRPLPVGVGNEMASAPVESFELSHNQLSIRHHFQGDTWRTWKEKIHNLDCRILLICRFVQHMVCELNVSNFWGIFFLLCRTPTGATKAETAVVTGYNASQSHPQPLPSFQTHQRVRQAAEKPLQSPWSRVVLVPPPAQSSSMLGAGKQTHACRPPSAARRRAAACGTWP